MPLLVGLGPCRCALDLLLELPMDLVLAGVQDAPSL